VPRQITKGTEMATISNDQIDAADERFLTGPMVRERYAVSDMWLHRRLRDDSGFPKPMTINSRRFWRLSDLVAWERGRAAGRPEPRPVRRLR
jgi:predicted DNA-binding transcriptional regulator AlpA